MGLHETIFSVSAKLSTDLRSSRLLLFLLKQTLSAGAPAMGLATVHADPRLAPANAYNCGARLRQLDYKAAPEFAAAIVYPRQVRSPRDDIPKRPRHLDQLATHD